jgi:hypothetical protein
MSVDISFQLININNQVTSAAAVIAYGVSLSYASTVFSFCLFVICAILVYDICKYHRCLSKTFSIISCGCWQFSLISFHYKQNSYVALQAEQANRQITTLKLLFAICFGIVTGFGTVVIILFAMRFMTNN